MKLDLTQPTIQISEQSIQDATNRYNAQCIADHEASNELERFIGTCESYGNYPLLKPDYSFNVKGE